jgi:hypothetical protein
MKIRKETLEKLKDLGYSTLPSFKNSYADPKGYEDADVLVVYDMNDERWAFKRFSTPKKQEVTLDWIMNKLIAESKYKNLSDMFSKLFKDRGYVYPATYGIGLDNFWIEDCKKNAALVENKLRHLGIKFRTEFSDAGWVYRFVISKEKSNLEKLAAL